MMSLPQIRFTAMRDRDLILSADHAGVRASKMSTRGRNCRHDSHAMINTELHKTALFSSTSLQQETGRIRRLATDH